MEVTSAKLAFRMRFLFPLERMIKDAIKNKAQGRDGSGWRNPAIFKICRGETSLHAGSKSLRIFVSGGAGEHFLTIAKRDRCRIRKAGSILRAEPGDGNGFSDFQRIARPPAPQQAGRTGQFNFPTHDISAVILHVHMKTGMRIDPF